jgi:hypothetical protein
MTLDWLLSRVVVCPSGCWIWAGSDSGNGRGGGYPKANGEGGTYYVHRRVYQVFKGRIPRGWQVDHKCRMWGWLPMAHRRCVNPDHLEAVRPEINQQRKHKANGTARVSA